MVEIVLCATVSFSENLHTCSTTIKGTGNSSGRRGVSRPRSKKRYVVALLEFPMGGRWAQVFFKRMMSFRRDIMDIFWNYKHIDCE